MVYDVRVDHTLYLLYINIMYRTELVLLGFILSPVNNNNTVYTYVNYFSSQIDYDRLRGCPSVQNFSIFWNF